MKLSFDNIKTAIIYKKNGILPKDYFKVINKRTNKNLKKGHIILKSDLKQ